MIRILNKKWSHASVEMQATELYEIILQIEDERTQGASAQPSCYQYLTLLVCRFRFGLVYGV
jgi:hypothetical protein